MATEIDVSRRRDVDPTLPIYVGGLIKRAIAAGHGSDSFGRLLQMIAIPGGGTPRSTVP